MGKYADLKGTTNPSFRVGGTVSAGDVLMADAAGVGAWSHTSYADLNRFGFMGTPETSISFDGTDTFTLTALAGTWSYYRSGLKYTISGNKTKVLATPMVDNTLYFIYIDATDGTLTSATSGWTLNDTKVPVATVYWQSTLTPKFIMADERHTCLIDRRWHREHHFVEGVQIATGGTISGTTLNSTTPASKVFSIAETQIFDEDLAFTVAGLTKPDGATAVYYNVYRTSVTVGAVPAKWNWVASDMPFKYAVLSGTPTYDEAEYDLNGTSTPASDNSYINTYLVICNSVNNTETFPNSTADTRFLIVQGRVNVSTTTAAYAESFGSFDMSGFPVSEAVAVYQFTWRCNEANTVKGRCTLNRVQRISTNIVQTTTTTIADHNSMGGLQGGAIGEYFHLTDAQHTALHDAVTVSAPAPIALSGQVISLVNNAVSPGTIISIDVGTLASTSDLAIPTSKAVATAIAAGGSSGHIIQNEGTPLTERPALNFVGPGVVATDSASPESTIVTIGADGMFEPDIDGDLEPVTDGIIDEYFEVDDNGDIQPSTATADAYAITGANTFTGLQTMPSIKITTGAGASKILTSDADGDATWVTPAAGGMVWSLITSNPTPAVKNNGYLCNTTSAAFTVTLPASPTAGDCIGFADAAGTFDINNLTIGRAALKIMGLEEDMTVSTKNAAFSLVYASAALGWRLV